MTRKTLFVAAALFLASAAVGYAAMDIHLSTKAPHICDDCQSLLHTR